MNLFMKQKQTQTQKQTFGYQRGKGGYINQEFGINRYTLLYIKQINNKDLLYNLGNHMQYLFYILFYLFIFIQQVLISYLFYTYQCIHVNPKLPIHPTTTTHHPLSPLGVHTFVLYICVSISALQTGSSVPFFQIPHICIIYSIFVFLFLTYFTLYDSLQIQPRLYR